jgi:hypothetical protein
MIIKTIANAQLTNVFPEVVHAQLCVLTPVAVQGSGEQLEITRMGQYAVHEF